MNQARRLLRALESRPLTRLNRAGAWLAILTCPCHVGVAVILLGGTAAGGWLAASQSWVTGVMAVLFVGGLGLLFRRDSAACDSCHE